MRKIRRKAIDYGRVDWSKSVRSIALELGCSCQRLYQVMKECGIVKPTPTIEDRLLRISPEKHTLQNLAIRYNCSTTRIATALEKIGKVCKTPSRYRITDSEPFRQWLIDVKKYPARVAGNIVSRCGKVERAYSIRLDRIKRTQTALDGLIGNIKKHPRLLLKQGASNRSLAAYKFSLKRYWEYHNSN